jgi:hypothetical protein
MFVSREKVRKWLYQIQVNYPFFGAVKANGRWQMAEGKKDFSRQGGYQGGFGISV